jgi:hypothetical protein
MQNAIEQFCREASQIIGPDSPFVKSLTLETPPRLIYHYTNDVGLKGILESGKLWLTEVSSLNDPSELNHGFGVAVRELKGMVINEPTESQKFAADLELVAAKDTIQKSADFFICSFSLCGDDLGQWRAYADNGRGFALGFDAAALEAGSKLDSFPLAYDDDKLAEIDREIIAKALPLARFLNFKDDLSIAFMTYVTNTAIYFKHPAYKSEIEYRFLEAFSADASPSVCWRARRNALIRYREFDWRNAAPRALKEIIVGPADQGNARRFANECLCWHPDAENVAIIPSLIPYKAF